MGSSERQRELRRRRSRKEKATKWKKRAETATVSEKAHIAEKLRRLTPGAEELIQRWGLEERV